jgi:hypothetical protein
VADAGDSEKVGFLVTSIGRPAEGGGEKTAARGCGWVASGAAHCRVLNLHPATLRSFGEPSVTRKVCHTGRRERHAARARSGEIPEHGMLDR